MGNDFLGHGVEGISNAIPRKAYKPYAPYGGSYYDRPVEDPNAEILGRDMAGWKVEAHTPEWMEGRGIKPHFGIGQVVYLMYGIWESDFSETPYMSKELTVMAQQNDPELFARCHQAAPCKRMVKCVVVNNNVTGSMGGHIYLIEVVDGPMAGLRTVSYPRNIVCIESYTNGAGRHVDEQYTQRLLTEAQQQKPRLLGTLVLCTSCSAGRTTYTQEMIISEKDAYLDPETGLYYHPSHKPEA